MFTEPLSMIQQSLHHFRGCSCWRKCLRSPCVCFAEAQPCETQPLRPSPSSRTRRMESVPSNIPAARAARSRLGKNITQGFFRTRFGLFFEAPLIARCVERHGGRKDIAVLSCPAPVVVGVCSPEGLVCALTPEALASGALAPASPRRRPLAETRGPRDWQGSPVWCLLAPSVHVGSFWACSRQMRRERTSAAP